MATRETSICPNCGTDHHNIRSMSADRLSKVLAELAIAFREYDDRDIGYVLDTSEEDEGDVNWLWETFGAYLERKAGQLNTIVAANILGEW